MQKCSLVLVAGEFQVCDSINPQADMSPRETSITSLKIDLATPLLSQSVSFNSYPYKKSSGTRIREQMCHFTAHPWLPPLLRLHQLRQFPPLLRPLHLLLLGLVLHLP